MSADPIRSRSSLTLAALALTAWAAFVVFCVHGFPPAVDLPAHGAQVETLLELLRGGPASAHYAAHFPIGYGLTTWLLVPVAAMSSGAFAVRAAVWLTLVLLPVSLATLARAFGRSGWVAVLGAPLGFNISYWYGFLPTLFPLPFVVFGWALFLSLDKRPSAVRVGLLALLGVFVMLCHLVAFGALVVGLVALAIASSSRRRALRVVALALLPSVALCVPRVIELLERLVHPTGGVPNFYDLAGHFGWVLRNEGNEGRLAVWTAIVTALVFLARWWLSRRNEPIAPVVLLAGLALFYLLTPKALSAAWLVYPRLGVYLAIAALMLVDLRSLGAPLLLGLSALCLASLVGIARFHARFAREVAGLDALVSRPVPAGAHGGFSLQGLQVSGWRLPMLEHLPQWWTATGGGIGVHFFADADHQPVQFRPGRDLPGWLLTLDRAQLTPFDSVLVFGDGPVPAAFSDFREVERVGHWRRLDRAVR